MHTFSVMKSFPLVCITSLSTVCELWLEEGISLGFVCLFLVVVFFFFLEEKASLTFFAILTADVPARAACVT